MGSLLLPDPSRAGAASRAHRISGLVVGNPLRPARPPPVNPFAAGAGGRPAPWSPEATGTYTPGEAAGYLPGVAGLMGGLERSGTPSYLRDQPAGGGVAAEAATAAGVGTQDPAKAILFAQQQLGKPYSGPLSKIGGGRFGDPGYDCSSFVAAAYKELGIDLTPYTDAAAKQTKAIPNEQAAPGDIIYYKYDDPSQPGVTYPHMGIYLGGNQMIDASYSPASRSARS